MVDCEIKVSGASSQRARSIESMSCSSKGFRIYKFHNEYFIPYWTKQYKEKKNWERDVYTFANIINIFICITIGTNVDA